jgi:putative DNA methylase
VRALVKAAHGEEPPLVVDPFAGGGSIPLEALRLGCEAFASDLNPVACLILKVMLEDIPAPRPETRRRVAPRRGGDQAAGGEGACRSLPEGPRRRDAHRLPVWARTVRCESPNCGAEIPLVRSFWLCKKASRKRALVEQPCGRKRAAARGVRSLRADRRWEEDVPSGTVTRAKATCVCCGAVLPPERVRAQLAGQRGGADVVFDAEGRRIRRRAHAGGRDCPQARRVQGRHYRLPTGGRLRSSVQRAEAGREVLEEWEA